MIINVRGANGSGKSTVVRRVLEQLKSVAQFVPGRGRPFGYRCSTPREKGLYIPGTYENPTGGCDTISSIEMIFESIRLNADIGRDVLYEGILAQHGVARFLELNKVHPITAVVLTTPVEECCAAVMARRREKGDDRPLQPSKSRPRYNNVELEFMGVASSTKALIRAGVEVVQLDREAAFQFCMANLWKEAA